MTELAPQRRLTPRFAAGWAALLVFISCGYFQNTRPGWNVTSQYAFACAMAERGTFAIDAYVGRYEFDTNDYALFNGHKYSDKSLFTPLLAAPIVWLYRHYSLTRALAMDYVRARWWCTWLVCGGASALLAGLLTLLLMRHHAAPRAAALAAVAYFFATPLFGYAILFFNYLPACALALLGWWIAEPFWMPALACTVPLRRALLAGLALGLATWALNTLAIPAIVITLLFCAAVFGASAPAYALRWRILSLWMLGGLLGVAGHFIYTYAVFHAFTSAYVFEADPMMRAQMAHGLMGATRPSLLVAWLITFHPYHGLFFWWPLTLLALLGALWLAAKQRASRAPALAILAIFLLFLLYNSAYYMWWGGWAYAPRHLIPALPFLALGLAPWICARAQSLRAFFYALACLGIALNVPLVALDPQYPPGVPNAVFDPATIQHWPIPLWDALHVVWRDGQTDQNWGTQSGLSGPASLLPLLLLWALAVALLALRARPAGDPQQNA